MPFPDAECYKFKVIGRDRSLSAFLAGFGKPRTGPRAMFPDALFNKRKAG
jgi:hypothetical protein